MVPPGRTNRQQPVPKQRAGEGVCVDFNAVPVTSVGGSNTQTFTADLGGLPVPDRRYSADQAFIDYRDETFFVMFGQDRLDRRGLRNLLAVKMTPAAVDQFLQTLTHPAKGALSDKSLEDVAASGGIEHSSLGSFNEEPGDAVTLNANIVLAALSGREACMDFYYASPFSKAAMFKSHQLAVDPIVRVDLRTSLLLGLIDEFRNRLTVLPESLLKDGGPLAIGRGL